MTPKPPSPALLVLAVALGSLTGGCLRALASAGLLELGGHAFPWGTLFVNVAGSWAIGAYAALAAPDGRLRPSPWRDHFVTTGLCGGFTTFSVLSLESLRLLQDGRIAAALLYVAASIGVSLAAAWSGHRLASRRRPE